jgi:hypothetical protein
VKVTESLELSKVAINKEVISARAEQFRCFEQSGLDREEVLARI